jgi:hypothetical protein
VEREFHPTIRLMFVSTVIREVFANVEENKSEEFGVCSAELSDIFISSALQ